MFSLKLILFHEIITTLATGALILIDFSEATPNVLMLVLYW